MISGLSALLCALMSSAPLVDAFTALRPRRHSALSSFSTSSSYLPPVALCSVENDDEIEPSRKRNTRLAREDRVSKRFATGEELKNLRLDLESLRQNLQWAEALKDEVRIDSLEKAIHNGENRDPDFMYKKSLRMISQANRMKDASREERDALIENWTTVADAARSCLPQFNLDGLWVGK